MRTTTLLLAAGALLAVCGCDSSDDPPPLKTSAPASQPAPKAPAVKPETAKPAPPAQPPASPPPAAQTPTSQASEPPPLVAENEGSEAPITPPSGAMADDAMDAGAPTPATPPLSDPAEATPVRAIARLAATAGNQAAGTVTFTTEAAGVKVQVSLTGLTPGEHGFHIHEVGDCSAPDAASAGEHFGAAGETHGAREGVARHAGDLGNLTADAQGQVETSFVDERIALIGPGSIVQRAIVVHSEADDFVTQPSGNSGSPVACGVIEIQP